MSCISVVPVPKLIQAAASPLLHVRRHIYFCVFRVGMPWVRAVQRTGITDPDSLWPLSTLLRKVIILELVFTQNQAETHPSIISLRPTNKHQTGPSCKSLWTWTNFETLP